MNKFKFIFLYLAIMFFSIIRGYAGISSVKDDIAKIALELCPDIEERYNYYLSDAPILNPTIPLTEQLRQTSQL